MAELPPRATRVDRRSWAAHRGLRDPIGIEPRYWPLLGTWVGMVTGLLELGGFLAVGGMTGVMTSATLTLNWHYAWMIPASNLILFLALGAVLGWLARVLPRRIVVWIAAYVFGFLSPLAVLLVIPKVHPIALAILVAGLSFWTAPVVVAHFGILRHLVRRTFPALAAAVLALVAWKTTEVTWSESRTLAALPPVPEGAPNVLLIVLDTVRADALSLYGSVRDTTPNLARLARRGVRFNHARATAPWTLPSHASLFTGRWPHEVVSHVAKPLDDSFPTLAEFLAAHGYATAGFAANAANCNAWFGLSRGFAHYEDYYENQAITPVEILRSSNLGRLVVLSNPCQILIKAILKTPRYFQRKSAAMINRDVLTWLSGRTARPFFLFVNFFDAHDPYELPEGAAKRFSHAAGCGPRLPREAARDAYDDCLAYLDDQLGRLFHELENRGTLENTLVIITADHGEEFGEHSLSGHGVSLYRPELHVPLVIIFPSRVPEGWAIDDPVSLRNIPATIADLLGWGDEAPFPGTSLVSWWNGSAKEARNEPILSEVDRTTMFSPVLAGVPAGLGPMQSILADGQVYIRNGNGREELYDFEKDPEEARNLAHAVGARHDLERFRDILDSFFPEDTKPPVFPSDTPLCAQDAQPAPCSERRGSGIVPTGTVTPVIT